MNPEDSGAPIKISRPVLFSLGIGVLLGIAIGLAIGVRSTFNAEKFLEWPFVAFVAIGLCIALFYEPLAALLGRGEFLISWGKDRSIRIRELSSALDEELDPMKDDIDTLKRAVQELQNKTETRPGPSERVEATTPALSASDRTLQDAAARIRSSLEDPQWRWRSVERLAIFAGVTEQQALDIIRGQPDMVLSIGKSGRMIARLRSK